MSARALPRRSARPGAVPRRSARPGAIPRRSARPGAARRLVALGSALAVCGTLQQVANLAVLRRPPTRPQPVDAPVSVLVPARDEAHRIAPTIRSLRAQRGVADLEILVLDDGSTDGTAAVAAAAAEGDPRVRVLSGAPLAPGWLGKPHAGAQLAAAARGEVQVYVDADVVLAPAAVAAAVATLRDGDLALLCPWPRQVATGPLARLVQPLLAWSWLTTLPLSAAERSVRPSMAVAAGQFLAVDAHALRRAGGWEAVRAEVLDDLAIARAIRRSGGRTGVADGSALATCRMYDSARALHEGYRKSLWAAFASPVGAVAVGAVLLLAYVLPPAAALTGSRTGAVGYLAAVAGRRLASRFCPPPSRLDALGHPLSIVAVVGLAASSWVGRARRELTWKGRRL